MEQKVCYDLYPDHIDLMWLGTTVTLQGELMDAFVTEQAHCRDQNTSNALCIQYFLQALEGELTPYI